MPTGKYAASQKLSTNSSIAANDCYSSCFANTTCQALTFTSGVTASALGTCVLYARGGGSPGQMKLTKAPGTFFYNRACLTRLDCFYLISYIDNINNDRYGFSGQSQVLDMTLTPPRLIYTESNDQTDNYGIFYLDAGQLYNDAVGLPAMQYTVSTTDWLIFPNAPSSVEYTQVNCTLAPDPDYGTETAVNCVNGIKNTYFDCLYDGDGTTPAGLYLSNPELLTAEYPFQAETCTQFDYLYRSRCPDYVSCPDPSNPHPPS